MYSGGSDGKESACNVGDPGSIPGWRRSPGEGNGNPFQCSCLEDSMDRGAWQATVPGGPSANAGDVRDMSPSEDSPLTRPQGVGQWLRGWHAASFILGSVCLTSSKEVFLYTPLLKALALKGRTEDWRLCDLDSQSPVSAL